MTFALIGAAIWLAVSLYSGVPLRDYRTIYVEVPQVGNLLSHDPVRIGGVRVGQVAELQTTPAGEARVKVQLEPGTELGADTRVAVRANGLLGARYLQLLPGRSAAPLADGATVRAGSDALTNGIPEALNAFDAPTRAYLGETVNELGRGLLGRGAGLNDSVRALTSAAVPFQRVTHAILDRPGAAQRLVTAVDMLIAPLAGSRVQLVGLVRSGSRAVSAVAGDRPALRRLLDALPGALETTRTGAAAGTRLLAATELLASASNRTLPPLPAGLRQTRLLLKEAPTPLERTADLLESASSGVPAARSLLRSTRPVLPRLSTAVNTLRPMIDYVGPYKCDIANFGVVFRSVTGFGGAGRGAAGSPGEFRLALVAPNLPEVLGTPSPTLKKDAYPDPCRYLGKGRSSASAGDGR